MLTHTPRCLRLATAALVAAAVSSAARLPAETPKAKVSPVAGTWTWTWNDRTGATHRHVLEVEGADAKLAAREVFDDAAPVRVSNLSLKDKAIKFTVVRGENRADYAGKVDDADHINGKVHVTTGGETNEFVWKAERRKDVPK